MKRLLILLIIALPIIWWVKNPQSAKQSTAQALRFISTKAYDLAEKLDAGAQGGTETATSSRPERPGQQITLAEGVYVVRENVPAKPNPVPGLIPKGSQVRVIGEGQGRKIVSDGTREAIVEDRLLTRDPAEVGGLLESLQSARQAHASQKRSELEAELSRIDAKIAATKQELEQVRMRDAKAKEEGKRGPQYGTQEQFLLTEITRQEGFRDAVMKQLQAIQ